MPAFTDTTAAHDVKLPRGFNPAHVIDAGAVDHANSVIDFQERKQKRKRGRPPKAPTTTGASPACKPDTLQLQIAEAACAGNLMGALRADSTGTAIWRWADDVWSIVHRQDGEVAIEGWLDTNARDAYKSSVVEDGWKQARRRIIRTAPRKPDPDRSRIIMGMRGGYLEVEKGTGRITALAPDPELGRTFLIKGVSCPVAHGAEYTPRPLPPMSRFSRYLMEMQPDEQTRRLVQEQCALTFTGVAHRSVAYWSGDAGNGKSVMQDILMALHERPVSLNLHRLGEKNGMAQVIGATLLVVAETMKGGRWPVDRWKALTAGDGLPVELKYKDEITYANTACMIMISNVAASYDDSSDGVAERLVPVRWTKKPAKRVNRLQDIIVREEIDIVLDWILEGLQRIARRGGEMMPREEWPQHVHDALAESRREGDPVRRCVEELGWFYDPTLAKRPKADVWTAWCAWCHAQGLVDKWGNGPFKTPAEFWRALRDLSGHDFGASSTTEVIGSGHDRVPACRIALGAADAKRLRDEAAPPKPCDPPETIPFDI